MCVAHHVYKTIYFFFKVFGRYALKKSVYEKQLSSNVYCITTTMHFSPFLKKKNNSIHIWINRQSRNIVYIFITERLLLIHTKNREKITRFAYILASIHALILAKTVDVKTRAKRRYPQKSLSLSHIFLLPQYIFEVTRQGECLKIKYK